MPPSTLYRLYLTHPPPLPPHVACVHPSHEQSTRWGSATADRPARAVNFFIDCFRLRTEDHYTANEDVVGLYAESAGESNAAFKYIRSFLRKAKAKRAGGVSLPPWWTGAHDKVLLARAADHRSSEDGGAGYSVKQAIEQADVAKDWGREKLPVFRALANIIDGRIVDDDPTGGAAW